MPDQIKQSSRVISPDIYDEKYFYDVMPGKENYLASKGARISNLYKTVLNLADIRQGMIVLDFGCGRGELVYQSALKGAKAIGVDYSDAAIKLSKELALNLPENLRENARIMKFPVGKLPLDNKSIDRILLVDVIEHLTDDEINTLLSEFYRIMKPGARLIVHTPNKLHYDIAWEYYTYYIMVLTRLIRLKNPKKVPVELRTEDEKKVHINEQDCFSLKENFENSGFKKHRMIFKNIHEGDKIIKQYISDIVYNLFPLSVFWPLNMCFNHSLFGVAVK